MVEEGNGQKSGAHDEEREYTIGAIKERKVVEKDFGDHEAEKKESLPAEQRPLALRAKQQKQGGVSSPEDGDRKMLRKGVAGAARAATEVVPEAPEAVPDAPDSPAAAE